MNEQCSSQSREGKSGAMARLACRCLNINVFVANNDWRSNPLPTSKLFSERCQLKEDVAYEVNLDVAGIVVVSEYSR